MGTDITTHFQGVFQQLKSFGVLLESDPKLPSVCTLITAAPMKGSWWSHPMAQIIFQVNERLEDHKDVLITKLVAGKVTFVHRKLWPKVLAIGISREPWQLKNLSSSAHLLLQTIDEGGSVKTNELPAPPSGKAKLGDVARELEKKLLIHAGQTHTASGAHAKVLETWEYWAERVGFENPPIRATNAKKTLEERCLRSIRNLPLRHDYPGNRVFVILSRDDAVQGVLIRFNFPGRSAARQVDPSSYCTSVTATSR